MTTCSSAPPDGTPNAECDLTYAHFVTAFRVRHRLSENPDAREVCVLCGGPLGETPEVDHWIGKSPYPLLSVCANNLLPICGVCNSTSPKGTNAVHSSDSFEHWFHPYLRSGSGRLRPSLVQLPLEIECVAVQAIDQPKVANLDCLLHLYPRWTKELKAEHAKHLDVLRRAERKRLSAGEMRHTTAEVAEYIDDWRQNLLETQPHDEVHDVLGSALAEPARLAALHAELKDVSS